MAKHEAGDRKLPKAGTNIELDGKSYSVTPSNMILTDNETGELVQLDRDLRHYEFETEA